MNAVHRLAQPPTLKSRALQALARRDYSRAELTKKLRPYASPDDDLPALLEYLTAHGLISEKRVAESLVNRRAVRLGSGRLKQELQAKGLHSELVTSTLAKLAHTELARAHAVWRKKFGVPPADRKATAAQSRFLLARGFAPEIVRGIIRADSENWHIEDPTL